MFCKACGEKIDNKISRSCLIKNFRGNLCLASPCSKCGLLHWRKGGKVAVNKKGEITRV
jgi:hypothetical protein